MAGTPESMLGKVQQYQIKQPDVQSFSVVNLLNDEQRQVEPKRAT